MLWTETFRFDPQALGATGNARVYRFLRSIEEITWLPKAAAIPLMALTSIPGIHRQPMFPTMRDDEIDELVGVVLGFFLSDPFDFEKPGVR